jgi:formate hydrogenlyase transcriptional activator
MFETVRQTLDHDYASLITFEAGNRELRLEAATYYDERGVMESHIATTFDQSPAVLATQGSAPRVFKGAELDQFDLAGAPPMRHAGLQCVCCVPLSTRRGVIGVLNVASRREDAFTQADIDLLRDIAGQVAIAVENTVAFREISDLKNRLAEEKLYLEGEVISQHDFKEIIGNSPALRGVLHQIQTVAPWKRRAPAQAADAMNSTGLVPTAAWQKTTTFDSYSWIGPDRRLCTRSAGNTRKMPSIPPVIPRENIVHVCPH